MTLINEMMHKNMNSYGKVVRINTMPSLFSSFFPGILWTAVRTIYTPIALCIFLAVSIRSTKESILYTSISSGNGKYLEIPFFFIANYFYKTIFIHHHSYSYCNSRSNSFMLICQILNKKVNHVVLCNDMGNRISKIYNQDLSKFIVLSNSVFLEALPAPLTQSPPTTIGFLGNITFDKGIKEFVETLQFSQHNSKCRGLIAGPPGDRAVAEYLEEILTKNTYIDYVGPVYGKDKANFFEKIDVLLFPTSYAIEAEPLTIYEAQSRGIPVIAVAKGCIASMLANTPELLVEKAENFSTYAAGIINSMNMNHDTYKSLAKRSLDNFIRTKSHSESSYENLMQTIFS